MKEIGIFRVVTSMDEVPEGASTFNICRPHIVRLRAAIVLNGLTPFVSASPEEAMAKMTDSNPNTPYDPLMAVILTICRVAAENGVEESGCPICQAVQRRLTMVDDPFDPPTTPAEFEDYWVNSPVQALADVFKENGWRLQ